MVIRNQTTKIEVEEKDKKREYMLVEIQRTGFFRLLKTVNVFIYAVNRILLSLFIPAIVVVFFLHSISSFYIW